MYKYRFEGVIFTRRYFHDVSTSSYNCFHIHYVINILNKKETSHAYLKYVFSGCECYFAIFILCINYERSSLLSK